MNYRTFGVEVIDAREMILVRWLCLATLLISGCKVKNTVPGLIEYRCQDDKSFWVDYGSAYGKDKPLPAVAIIHFGDQAIRLPQSPDGAGIRYSDDFTSFQLRNGVARLNTRQGSYESCQATP
jgi:membrane-bound inhibitor of C-type lysozyme